MTQLATLYERIGGKAAVEAAVDIFYNKVIGDQRINHWFAHMDMQAQRIKQTKFLTQVFGGPSEYSGRDMAAAHSKLVEKGLNDDDYDAVAQNLSDTLIELGVEQNIVNEVADIVESVRGVVLCKDPAVFSQRNCSADDRWEPLSLLSRSLMIDGRDGDKVYRFSFANQSNTPLNLSCAQHLDVGTDVGGKWSIRNYSPVCCSSNSGKFDLVVKVYPDGRVSRVLQEGSTSLMGRWIKSHPKQLDFSAIKKLLILCCGVASTSLIRVLQESLPAHIPTVAVLSTRFEDEIVLKDELAGVVADADWIQLTHTITRPSNSYQGTRGRIDAALLGSLGVTSNVSSGEHAIICGENAFISSMRSITMKDFGYAEDNIHVL